MFRLTRRSFFPSLAIPFLPWSPQVKGEVVLSTEEPTEALQFPRQRRYTWRRQKAVELAERRLRIIRLIQEKAREDGNPPKFFGSQFLDALIVDGDVFIKRQGREAIASDIMWRIETVKGKLIEFQRSWEGPNYEVAIDPAHRTKSQAVRFAPDEIVHFRVLGNNGYYPYGRALADLSVSHSDGEMADLFYKAAAVGRQALLGWA